MTTVAFHVGQAPAPLPAPPDAPDQATIPPVEPLTERGQQVLRRVSGMLIAAEIAGELYISTQHRQIAHQERLHKLAVGHRGEAVRRARQLQLI